MQHNDKSESLKDATLAITAASRSTHTGQHMSRGRKKARREIEAEPEVPADSDYLSLSRYLSFFSIYITDICQTSESFPKSVNLK